MFDSRYRRATWTVFAMTVFNQWTGIDALTIYSNRILTKIAADADPGLISPNLGTSLMGAMVFIGACFSVFPVRKYGRVPVLIIGHVAMGVCHSLLSYAILNNLNFVAVMIILAFVLAF
jgi:hypothetical protein